MNKIDFAKLCEDIPARDLTLMLLAADEQKAEIIRQELKRRMPQAQRPLWLEVRVE